MLKPLESPMRGTEFQICQSEIFFNLTRYYSIKLMKNGFNKTAFEYVHSSNDWYTDVKNIWFHSDSFFKEFSCTFFHFSPIL